MIGTFPKLAGAFLLIVASATAGCDKTIRLTFINHTDRSAELELEGPHTGEEDIGYVAAGGRFDYTMVIEEKDLPADFELEAGKHETDFTVNKHTPGRMYVQITPRGIIGPTRHAPYHGR